MLSKLLWNCHFRREKVSRNNKNDDNKVNHPYNKSEDESAVTKLEQVCDCDQQEEDGHGEATRQDQSILQMENNSPQQSSKSSPVPMITATRSINCPDPYHNVMQENRSNSDNELHPFGYVARTGMHPTDPRLRSSWPPPRGVVPYVTSITAAAYEAKRFDHYIREQERLEVEMLELEEEMWESSFDESDSGIE